MTDLLGMLGTLGRTFSLLLALAAPSALNAQEVEYDMRPTVTATQPAKMVASSAWTQRTEMAEWKPRSLHACVNWPSEGVFVIGGFNGDDTQGDLGDVWYLPPNATDDISVEQTWHQHPVDGNGFSPRHGHSIAVRRVTDTKHIIITGGTGGGPPMAAGGDLYGQHGGTFFGDLWRSSRSIGSKTIDWELDSAQYPGRSGHVLVVLDHEDLVLMGGISGGMILNDIWCMGPKCEMKAEDWLTSSNCRVSWCRVAQQAPWDPREDAASGIVPTMLRGQPTEAIIFGGGLGPGEAFNDVWFSTDGGGAWTRLTKAAQWSPRSGHAFAVTTESQVVLFGGTYGGSYMSDVWASVDAGVSWSLLTSAAPWSPRSSHCVVTTAEGIMLIGGFDGNKDLNDVWSVEFELTDAAIAVWTSPLIISAVVALLHF
jgi:hypothetical protein